MRSAFAQTREEKVRGDKAKVEADGFWIYNDLAAGLRRGEEDRASRCSSSCAAFPARSASSSTTTWSTRTRGCGRCSRSSSACAIVSTNGLDLSLFQFDTDQSFAVFLLNADGTIYGRFGTRSRPLALGRRRLDRRAGQGAAKGRWPCTRRIPENKAELAAKTRAGAGVRRAREVPDAEGQVRRAAQLRRQRRAELHPLPPDRRRPAASTIATKAADCPTRCSSPIRIPRRSA